MRKDPYQDRARELCAAADIDPESRVGQGRGRPAWCDYREAARVEKVAREQAALAATTKQNPDAPAPIVVGQHDENTVGQMMNCMSYGNVAAGVICADGHLGYAQPVGGVIAYRDQISVSGVGFDIACGNMAVKLDTKFEQIKDSVGTIVADIGRTPRLDRRSLWLARFGPLYGDQVFEARWRQGRHECAARYPRGQQRSGARLSRRHGAWRPIRLCRPGVGRRTRPPDSRRIRPR